MKEKNQVLDMLAIPLNTSGFNDLPEKQKRLIYHLTKAGRWGNTISLMQTSEHNYETFNMFIDAWVKIKDASDISIDIKNEVHDALFTLFIHSGIYHNTTGELLNLKLSKTTLKFLEAKFSNWNDFYSRVFSDKTPLFQTVQNSKDDPVLNSGVGFYRSNYNERINTQEVIDYRNKLLEELASDEEKRAPNGFNNIIFKRSNGELFSSTINSSNIVFQEYIWGILNELRNALHYTENEEQRESILSLINVYITGKAIDFDQHCVKWTKDTQSNIYFVNGFIESYDDPLGVACTYESLVAFKNPKDEKRVSAIIKNIQWFENSLPVDSKYKKEKAFGLSASSVNVISMSGKTNPILPLGINLPNSDWIRKEYGSKSVTLSNVAQSTSNALNGLSKEFYLKEYLPIIEKYDDLNRNLHIDLHEIAGHGSCKTMEGVSKDSLGIYYSIIEEARADLVALYYSADQKFEELGVYGKDETNEIAKACYVSYFTNALLTQLRRIKIGNDLTQAHLRNRQLIASYILSKINSNDASLVFENGKHYVSISNVQAVRKQIGELLKEIQRIKSEGDFESAKSIVENFGTKVDLKIHKETLGRVEKLNLPSTIAYIAPKLFLDENNNVQILSNNNFIDTQIDLYLNYFN